MKLEELMAILSPMIENKYTRYKSIDVRYSLGRRWWHNGKDFTDEREFKQFVKGTGGWGWKTLGSFEQDTVGISKLIIYDDVDYATIEQLRTLLNGTHVAMEIVKAPH